LKGGKVDACARRYQTSASDTLAVCQRSFGEFSDKALREAVAITKQGRDHPVLVSADEYARLKRRDRKVGLAGDLSDEWLDAVRKARAPTKRPRRAAR
jgi:hypothetical protein